MTSLPTQVRTQNRLTENNDKKFMMTFNFFIPQAFPHLTWELTWSKKQNFAILLFLKKNKKTWEENKSWEENEVGWFISDV